MTVLFLSYRRSDTGGEVGRLSDSLKKKLGKKTVFRDVSDIPLGADFDAELDKRIDEAKVVLVMIGPDWLEELKTRLEEPDIDYLREEVATALSKNKRVVPVLLKGAALPSSDALPGDLESLAGRQAMTIRDEAWDSDVDRLLDAIGRPYRWDRLAVRAVVAVVAIILVVWALVPRLVEAPITDYGVLQSTVIALVGIYALIEGIVCYRYFGKLKKGYMP